MPDSSRSGRALRCSRLSLILSGGPALEPAGLNEYMTARPVHTIVRAAAKRARYSFADRAKCIYDVDRDNGVDRR